MKLSAKSLHVSEKETAEAEALVDPDAKAAIAASKANVHAFAKRSLRKDWKFKNKQGAQVGGLCPTIGWGCMCPEVEAPLVSTA